jgi:hypothetical protein
VAWNCIVEHGAKALADTLCVNTTLTSLDMSANGIGKVLLFLIFFKVLLFFIWQGFMFFLFIFIFPITVREYHPHFP